MRHAFVRSLAGSRDPNFKNVTLLLHGDGTNGGQNNTFLDSGPNNLTVTMSGGVSQGSFSPYGDRWSNYFDGTGDYLTVGGGLPSGQGTAFTLECWIWVNNLTNYAAITRGTTTSTFDFGVSTAGALVLDNTGVINICASANGVILVNAWHHVAITRSTGNIYKLWVNGTNVATSSAYTTSMTANTTIGYSSFSASHYFRGYISNFRVVTSEVYTAAFTPPTAPLTAITNTSLLTCQSNRFIDTSANNFTITRNGDVSVQRFSPFSPDAEYRTDRISGSGFFSSTFANYLVVNSATVNPGANPFTVESWVYYLGGAWKSWYAIAPGITYYIHNGSLSVWSPAGSNVLNVAVPTNAWTHIAVTRDLSNNLRAFVNGVLGGTVAISGAYNHNIPVIGERYGNGEPFFGYISGFRLLIGSAIYTSNFTVPTTPPAIINDTRWIVNFANSRIIDNTMRNNLQTAGNAQISTSVKKYGTGALYFDGNGDYLASPQNLGFVFGTGDFTIEFWLRAVAFSNVNVWVDTRIGGSSAAGVAIYTNSSGQVAIYSGIANIILSSAISTGQWYHIAASRSSGTIRLFIDGTSAGSASFTNNLTDTNLFVGKTNEAAMNYVNGYIDDLRITNGVARYTSNFTPPTAPFPDF